MPPETAPTVVQALSAVMGDVQAVGKTSRNTQQNYNFRGIDAVVNAVGPAFRSHGVVVVPVASSVVEERYVTKNGAAMKGVTATVTFRFYGPAGDYIEAQACGESSDSGDKAVPKAHSVAFRTMLLQALCIPTDEPDPDSASHERAVGTQEPSSRPALPRAERLRVRVQELATEADKARGVPAGSTWGEVCDAITWKHANEPEAGATWDVLTEPEVEALGVDLSGWAGTEYTGSLLDWVSVPF